MTTTTTSTAAEIPMLDVQIQHGTFVRAAPERVWEVLTTSSGVNRWFTSGAAWTHEPGSPMHWRWENWGVYDISTESVGEIIEVEPLRRFVFSWANGSAATPSTVTMTFEAIDGGTKVELVDSGYPDTPEGRHALMDCACGWGEALTLVKFFVEHEVTY